MSLRRMLLLATFALSTASVPAASQAKEYIVRIAPPAARVEVVPAERKGYVWAPGYWGWRNGRHVWVAGHWVRARVGYRWVPHRWEERDGRWHLRNGYWQR